MGNGSSLVRVEQVVSREPMLQVSVEWADAASLSSPFSLPRMMESVVTLARSGGFAGRTVDPSQSTVIQVSREIADRSARWTLGFDRLDGGAGAVVRNLVVFSSEHVTPVRHALVEVGLTQPEKTRRHLTGCFDAISFEVEVEPATEEIHVCIEFAVPPTPDIREHIDALLSAWAYVAAAGGFAAEGEDRSRPFALPQEDPEWLEEEVWFHLPDARLDDADFDVLINALHHVRCHYAEIARVSVE